MSKQLKEVINVILVIGTSFLYVTYISPLINLIFGGQFASIGIWLIVVGIWGNLVKMKLIKSLFIIDDYKKENYIFILIGCILFVIGIVQFLMKVM